MNDHYLLEARELSCEREDRLLFENLSFILNRGEILQVEGPNGAGKTTLLRMLSGLMPMHEGELLWHGEPMSQCGDDFLSEMLFLGHKTGIKTVLTPFENLRFWSASRFAVADEVLIDSLEKSGLGGFEHTPCHSLSAGQQRRAALARLHLSPATLWILDEAFTAIDKQGVDELEQWIGMKAAAGGSVILTTHHRPAHYSRFRHLKLGDSR